MTGERKDNGRRNKREQKVRKWIWNVPVALRASLPSSTSSFDAQHPNLMSSHMVPRFFVSMSSNLEYSIFSVVADRATSNP